MYYASFSDIESGEWKACIVFLVIGACGLHVSSTICGSTLAICGDDRQIHYNIVPLRAMSSFYYYYK